MENIEIDKYLKKKLDIEHNFDIVRGVVKNDYIVYYLSSLVSNNTLQLIYQLMDEKQGYQGNYQKVDSMENIIISILSGLLFIIPLDNKDCYLLETREYPTRGLSEPETEQTIRGSKDGFCESIITNVALIRRRIRNENLTFKKYQIGTYSKCDVVLCFMKDKVNNKYLNYLSGKLESIKDNVESIVMSDRSLEEILFNQKLNIYPLVKYSERPDIVSVNVLKGKIALICDNSSSVIITPVSIFEHLRHIEEYRQNPIVGTFLRSIRIVAIMFSLLIIPLWLNAILNNDKSFFLIPKGIGFNQILYQVLVVELMIEVLRIATIHTPNKLSSTMGLVAALVLGQFAVQIGIFTQEIILYSSLSAIGGFATPSYELSLTNKIIKIILIISIGIFSEIGFVCSLFILFIYTVNINKKSCPILYPVIPFDLKEFSQLFTRLGKSDKKRVR